jgi:mono/diheme cytochrome c family protein
MRFVPSIDQWIVPCLAVALTAGVASSAAAPGDVIGSVPPSSFDRATIARGANLAAIGGCSSCHTVPGGMPYAGGVALQTPFGTIYGTNITPDAATGIGRWSEADFVRAMRDGVDRRGRHLYPAFPYPHFTWVTDDELHALYAYAMTRTPVEYVPPANKLAFPFNVRPLMAVWNALHLPRDNYRADPAQTPQWNRGAYLVQSLGHCGACHTPLDALGAEKRNDYLGGGTAEGWYAPPLDAKSPSPIPWTVDALTAYLRQGIVDQHAMAGGPMQGVVQGLAQAPEDDLRAMAIYIVSLMGGATRERDTRMTASLALANNAGAVGAAPLRTATDQTKRGEAIYASACVSCHGEGRRTSSGTALQLPLAVAVHESDPGSLIRIIRDGITAPEGERSRWMPPFAGALTDDQISALVVYLRTLAPESPPWQNVSDQVAKARRS